jgi:uncharacterized protein YggE
MSKHNDDEKNESIKDHNAHGCCIRRSFKWFICLALFGVGFLIGPIYLATSIQSIIRDWGHKKNTITLTGLGTKKVNADYATISMLICDGGSNREDTINRLQEKVKKITDALEKNNIQKDDIKKTNFSIVDSRKDDFLHNKEIQPFVVIQNITVSTCNIKSVASIQQQCLSWGIQTPIHALNISYQLNKKCPQNDKPVIIKAVNDAHFIAEKLKKEKGIPIGLTHSIQVEEAVALTFDKFDKDAPLFINEKSHRWNRSASDHRAEKILQAQVKVEYELGG